MRLLAAPAGRVDPGGTIDQTAPHDASLVYRAERVRTVTLAGRTLSLHSERSPPIAATLRDIFPPAVPSGLVAIDASQTPSGSTTIQAAVDLSWEPVADPDLGGYLVQRAESDGTGTGARPISPWRQINPSPAPAPAFHDGTARVGMPYLYRIVAVDTHGNQSAPGGAVGIEIAAPVQPR